MITAKEAKEQTTTNANKKIEKLLNKIEKKIKKAIKQNKTSCTVNTCHESSFVIDKVVKKLKSLGYQTWRLHYERALEISWEEEIGF